MKTSPKLTPWAQKPASWKLGGAGRVGPPPLQWAGATRTLLAAETRCQKQVHRTGKPKTVRDDGVTVHGWPVHTPEWKREILRAVVEEG